MPGPSAALELHAPGAFARILPDEGGVVSDLAVGGLSILASTPWRDTIRPVAEPAADEAEWVGRWHGGWQLCFPTAGQPEPGAEPVQGFHGAASQAPWEVADRGAAAAVLRWTEESGLTAERTWRLTGDSLSVSTTATNSGPGPRSVIVAEHLILGSELLDRVRAGEQFFLDVPESGLAPLDYSGLPAGPPVPWPGNPSDGWQRVDAATPARVAALVDPQPRRVRLLAGQTVVTVRWDGLPHALLWQELARSAEPPWNGEVLALGIEPTSTPHGAGTASGSGSLTLPAGGSLHWTTSLACTTGEPEEDTP